MRFLSELRALNDDYADAVEFAYLCGNRKGAIAKLRFDQVDRARQEIRYPSRAANKPDPDVVVLTGRLAELIEHRFARRVWQPKKGPAVISEFVFHHHGRAMGDIRKTWAKACDAVGIEDHRFHDLRHTAVTDLVDAGVSESVAMTMSGHRTGAVFKRYKVRTAASQRAAQEQVALFREGQRERLAEEAKKVVGLSNQNPTTLDGTRRQKVAFGPRRILAKMQ